MKKILLLGDSITEGIGNKKINYEGILKEKLDKNYNINNYALTGTTITYVDFKLIKQEKPDIIIIMYGNVDVQFRPNLRKNKYKIVSLLPKHYKKINGILNPRPFYSKKIIRHSIHIIDNIIRHVLKKIIVSTQGWYQYTTPSQFIEVYTTLINNILKLNNNMQIICISTVVCDDKIYNNSNKQYEIINSSLQDFCLQNNNCYYVDIYSKFQKEIKENGWDKIYYKDHFHPNLNGYKIIADEIIKKIEEIE